MFHSQEDNQVIEPDYNLETRNSGESTFYLLIVGASFSSVSWGFKQTDNTRTFKYGAYNTDLQGRMKPDACQRDGLDWKMEQSIFFGGKIIY